MNRFTGKTNGLLYLITLVNKFQELSKHYVYTTPFLLWRISLQKHLSWKQRPEPMKSVFCQTWSYTSAGTTSRISKVDSIRTSWDQDAPDQLKSFHMAVGLKGGEDDVHEPKTEKQARGEDLGNPGPTELSAYWRSAAIDEDKDANKGEDGEECDGECQRARVHFELFSLAGVVDSRDGPSHADSKKNVDGIASRHVADRGVCILVLDGCHLTGKGVWWRDDTRMSGTKNIFHLNGFCLQCKISELERIEKHTGYWSS